MPVFDPPAEFAARTARILLETKSVLFNAGKPFIFTSGWASPVYIDCRRLVSFKEERREVIKMANQLLQERVGKDCFDVVCGGETAGIPYAAWLSDVMDLPMLYVRKNPKGFGRLAQIEGDFHEGERVLLVEDLTTDGMSKAKFTQALRKAGAIVDHTFVVFHYGIFNSVHKTMDDIHLNLHALCTWWDMLKLARELSYFETSTMDEVEKYLHEPEAWSAAHKGATAERLSGVVS